MAREPRSILAFCGDESSLRKRTDKCRHLFLQRSHGGWWTRRQLRLLTASEFDRRGVARVNVRASLGRARGRMFLTMQFSISRHTNDRAGKLLQIFEFAIVGTLPKRSFINAWARRPTSGTSISSPFCATARFYGYTAHAWILPLPRDVIDYLKHLPEQQFCPCKPRKRLAFYLLRPRPRRPCFVGRHSHCQGKNPRVSICRKSPIPILCFFSGGRHAARNICGRGSAQPRGMIRRDIPRCTPLLGGSLFAPLGRGPYHSISNR